MTVEKADLHKLEENLKEHMSLLLVPITKQVDRHEKSLFGKHGTNGMSRSVIILWWVSGILTLGMGIVINKIFL